MGHVIGKNRDQIEILCLEDLVPEGSTARQIDKLVDQAETGYFAKSETKSTGRPPFNPKDMLKLYLYGMENGVVSSRKLDRECKRNIELIWLMKGLQPDDKTICNFRRENAAQITKFFREFCKALAKAGYIEGKTVGIDGTKIRANNSKRNNFSAKKLDAHIEYIDRKIAEYMTELDKNDKIEELQERKAKYLLFKQRIKKGEVTEVSTTDPDSRLMKQGNNGVDVSFNVQAAIDEKHKLAAGILVTNEPNDQGQLSKVANSVKDNLELEGMTAVADKGYYSTEDFKNCHENSITTIVAKPEDKNPDKDIFDKNEFEYDAENDRYRCPAGEILKSYHEDEKGYRRYRNCKACKTCPQKEHCTKGKYRVICRHKHDKYADQNNRNLALNPDIYKLRQLLCEHPFGTIKRTMGIRQFLTRGLTSVTAEAALIFLAYNLKRLRVIHKNENKKDGQTVQSARLFMIFLLLRNIFNISEKLRQYTKISCR